MARFVRLLTILPILFLCGCDLNKEVDKFYASMGLTRLKYVRDDLQPGGFIVVDKNSIPIYKDNVFDYTTEADEKKVLSLLGGDRMSDYNAVLSSYNGDRSIDANIAMTFLSAILPIKLSSLVSTSGKVTIDMTTAKVQRMKIPDLNGYLGSAESEGFRTAVNQALSSQGTSAYVIYEVFRTNQLKITTSSKFDFKTSATQSKDTAIVKAGSASFELKRNHDTELEIKGDKYYAFAVRTARLVGKPGNVVTIDTSTKFIPKTSLGGKEDIEYSRPILGDFEGVSLGSQLGSPQAK